MALRLVGEVALDGSGFERGLNRLSTGAVSSFRNTLASAFGGIAIGQLVRGTVEWASKLNDVSDALGVNVEWLQKMANGANLVGGNIGDINKMILEINKSRESALLNPEGKEAAAFGRRGIGAADIRTMNTQAFVQRFIESFKNGVTTQGANDIGEVGGRSARKLIAAFQSQFASDTPILATSLIQQLDDIGDAFTDLATMLKVSLAPAILFVMQKLLELRGNIGQTGTGLGAAHEAAQLGAAEDIRAGVPLGQRMVNVFKNLWKGFQHGVVSEAADQQNVADQIEMARKAAAAARTNRQGAAPAFDLSDIKTKKERAPASDALIAVGNFLGAGRPMIETIAERQLVQQTRIAAGVTDMAKGLKALADKVSILREVQGIEFGD